MFPVEKAFLGLKRRKYPLEFKVIKNRSQRSSITSW